MDRLIILGSNPDSQNIGDKGIITQTCKRTNIENAQEGLDASDLINKLNLEAFKKQHVGIVIRTNSSTKYNCHGMTFASRRTGIIGNKQLQQILHDDEYKEIQKVNDVLPGDIVLYIDNGDIEHSGIVVANNNLEQIPVPTVISKWGTLFECIHSVYNCPYEKFTIKYYRMYHGTTD